MARKDASAGGCWYCSTDDEPLVFCSQFDTNVHVKCAQLAYDKNPHGEAELIYEEVCPMAKDKDKSGHRRYDEPVDKEVGVTSSVREPVKVPEGSILTPVSTRDPATPEKGSLLTPVHSHSPLVGWSDSNDERHLQQARFFCEYVHAGQTRKYNKRPYSTHPLRCSAKALQLTKSYDVAIAMALHDGPEDQPGRCPFELILALYGANTERLVHSLTNPSKQHPDKNRSQRKEIDRHHYKTAPLITKICKAIDRIDNLAELDMAQDPGFVLLYTNESQLLLEVLRQNLDDSSPALHTIATTLFDQLTASITELRSNLNART